MPDAPVEDNKPAPSRLTEVARVFLKLGFTAFGGPAAHVALMEDEVVHRRNWLDRQHFLDMVSTVNFVPGPNSTELAIHVGLVRAGFKGLVVAGVCFIVPAMLIILPIAAFYVAFERTPRVEDALAGIKACMVAIVVVAMVRFTKTGVKDRFTVAVAALALVASLVFKRFALPQQELIILAAAAVAGMIYYRARTPLPPLHAGSFTGGDDPDSTPPATPSRALPIVFPLSAAATGFSAQILQMAAFFLKVGATLFGSGYVLASFLQTGLVEQHKWLTNQELLDAIAVGQVTPGPLLTAATFIGYLLGARNFGGGVPGGILGGVVATVAIFLPSFLFISILGPVLPRIRQSPRARGALDGMNAAVVSLILVVTLWLGQSALLPQWRPSWLAIGVFVASLLVLLLTRINATWLVLASGAVGVLARLV
jgi:chromate transporter